MFEACGSSQICELTYWRSEILLGAWTIVKPLEKGALESEPVISPGGWTDTGVKMGITRRILTPQSKVGPIDCIFDPSKSCGGPGKHVLEDYMQYPNDPPEEHPGSRSC